MRSHIELTVVFDDVDVLLVRVSAWSGKFGGTVETYVPVGGLAEAAAKLDGFPHRPHDERELVFGTFGPDWAGGAARLRFYCEGAGVRSFVECWFESDHQTPRGIETAHFHAAVEANSIDRFVADLERLEATMSGVAHLSTVPA